MIFLAAALLVAALGADAAPVPPAVPPPLPPAAPPVVQPVALPAGTHLRFHLVRPLSSGTSKTGQPFSFVLLGPVEVGGRILVPDGSVGSGTVLLAGHAGTGGHEGDLTLRLDTLPAGDAGQVTFCDQRLLINGRNRKIMSGVLGFVPFAGIGAHWIHGSDVRISTKTPIDTVLDKPTVSPSDLCSVPAGQTART